VQSKEISFVLQISHNRAHSLKLGGELESLYDSYR